MRARLRAAWLAGSALPFVAALHAAPVAPAVRTEIDALLTALQTSGCEFNRNGSWYTAAEARDHLLRKLEYLEGKDAVRSAEQFIALGATTSSSSGQPYRVRCGDAPPVQSQQWLSARLRALRGPATAATSGPR
jgi:hypothetical protein